MSATILDAIDGLVSSINGLALTVTNMIQVSCSQASTCGTSPPQPETVEEEDPPAGYSEHETSEKCKAANFVVDDILTLLGQLEANSVEEISALGIGALAALFALVVALLPTGPLALAVGVIGTVGSLIAFFLVQTVDLEDFIALIESLREDLVCALYGSTDNVSANADFRSILESGGATASALALLDAINFVNGLTLLFFSKDDISVAWQARLDGYTAITDCVPCGFLPCDWIIAPDTLDPDVEVSGGFMGSGTPTQDGSEFVITALQRDGGTYVVGMVTRAFAEGACGIFANGCACTVCAPLRLEAITALGSWSKWGVGCAGSPGLTGAGGANLPPTTAPSTMTNRVYIYWQNPSPFTVTLKVVV